MKIEDLVKKRVERVRLADWNVHAYLKIDYLPEGGTSPWVYLIDPKAQIALDMAIGQQRFLWKDAFGGEEDWLPFEGNPVFGF